MIKRREISVFSLSFMDCICCGFGAMILLFVLCTSSPNPDLEDRKAVSERKAALAAERETELRKLRADAQGIEAQIKADEAADEAHKLRKAALDQQINSLLAAIARLRKGEEALAAKVEAAQRNLDAREKALAIKIPKSDTKIPIGVPVENNHIVFVIDTSGSMRNPRNGRIWENVQRKIADTLEAYPVVTGIQALDADGANIIPSTKGVWIPDSPANRKRLVDAVRNYDRGSNSDPVPGITAAIRQFGNQVGDPAVSVGVYVFGDEFNDVTDRVLAQVERVNAPNPAGKRPATISAIGFPHVVRQEIKWDKTGRKFANLMRELAERHGGVFVGAE